MRVGVIGTGHVGLVTCVSLAALGHHVVGTDHDDEKIALLVAGRAPIFEPGVDELLAQGLDSGRLSFSADPREAIEGAEVVLISVGTPPHATGEANLIAVENAARAVARYTTGECVVVEKSTVPTGTASRLKSMFERENPERAGDLAVVANPEFLRQGRAIEDSLSPDRILVGAHSDQAFATMRRLYEPLIARGSRLIETDIATAELAKHACNAFLALKISYANALARLCERADADVTVVTEVMGSDPRIGPVFLDAGLGYGGSCFPKDLLAFERLAARLGYDFPLLNEVRRINDEALEAAVDKIKDALWNLEAKRVALLGLAFKPGTDDVRFSPAVALAKRLLDEGAFVVAYDPVGSSNAKEEVSELHIAAGPYEAMADAHCAVVCTAWPEFSTLDLDRMKRAMKYAIVVDGRNLFEADEMLKAGFTYYPTGRASRR